MPRRAISRYSPSFDPYFIGLCKTLRIRIRGYAPPFAVLRVGDSPSRLIDIDHSPFRLLARA